MPTASGITDGKTPYGEAQISLFSATSSGSQSGTGSMGSASGEQRFYWYLHWESNGFTDMGWVVPGSSIHIDSNNVDQEVRNFGPNLARLLSIAGHSDNCAIYREVP